MSTRDLENLVYSIGKQLRMAGLLGASERLELKKPTTRGKSYRVLVVRPSGVASVAPFCPASGSVGKTKPEAERVLSAVLRTLVMVNDRLNT